MKREHLWIDFEERAHTWWNLAEGGYPARMSVRQGDDLTLHISNSRAWYDVFIYHEGARRRLVHTIHDLPGQLQATPEHGYRNGFSWEPTVTLTIGDDWPSGVYIASFATAQGVREALFVVRPRTPRAAILATIEANTYHAYNPVGGHCFFPYLSRDRRHTDTVSFERPLPPDTLGNFYIWDQFFTSWLDAEGFEVDYCINADLDAEPELLNDYCAHLRIGHGEYVSRNECELLQRFVADGGALLVFAGNSFWHATELRDGGRQLYCNKTRYNRPPWPTVECPDAPTSFLHHLDNLRQRTIGVSYTAAVHAKTETPGVYDAPTTGEHGFFRVIEPQHWVFAGTNLRGGDEFGREDSIVGVEVDAMDIAFVNGRPQPTARDGVSEHYRILALADAAGGGLNRDLAQLAGETPEDRPHYATMAINETEFKGVVFVAATIEWSHGLHRADSAVPQITRNVLNRLGQTR